MCKPSASGTFVERGLQPAPPEYGGDDCVIFPERGEFSLVQLLAIPLQTSWTKGAAS